MKAAIYRLLDLSYEIEHQIASQAVPGGLSRKKDVLVLIDDQTRFEAAGFAAGEAAEAALWSGYVEPAVVAPFLKTWASVVGHRPEVVDQMSSS